MFSILSWNETQMGDLTVYKHCFVIQIWNKWNKRIFCFYNQCTSRCFISIGDVSGRYTNSFTTMGYGFSMWQSCIIYIYIFIGFLHFIYLLCCSLETHSGNEKMQRLAGIETFDRSRNKWEISHMENGTFWPHHDLENRSQKETRPWIVMGMTEPPVV